MPFDIVLFDDAIARQWQPFTATRPAGELLFGAMSFRARIERAFGARCIGHITDDALADFDEPGVPPVITGPVPSVRDVLYISSRFVPDLAAVPELGSESGVLVCDEGACGYFRKGSSMPPHNAFLLTPDAAFLLPTATAESGNRIRVRGRLVQRVWHLISGNPAQITSDIAATFPKPRRSHVFDRPGVFSIGEHPLIADESVKIEPGVVFDLSHGPIWLDSDVTIKSFTRLQGPSYIGAGTTLLGGPFTDVSIGPRCKVHGEMEESIVLGYTNKAHDGFLGHAYLGHWVNLGALTTNSDLKNNYGPVRLWTPEGEVDTGETKLGCLLGDHVKTGIGTMLNTGTVVGVGSNLFGAKMPPRYVPPFSWGAGEELTEYRFDKFIETAAVAMRRRDIELTERQRRMLEAVWQRSR